MTIGGVLASTRLELFERDTAYVEVAYGPEWAAIAVPRAPRWMPPAGSRPWTSSASRPATSITGPARWSSNAVVSPAWVVSEVGDPATSNDSFDYAP